MIPQHRPSRTPAALVGLLLILVAGGLIALQWLLRLHRFLPAGDPTAGLAPAAAGTGPWGAQALGQALTLALPVALAAALAHSLAWLPRRRWTQAAVLTLLVGFALRYLHWRATHLAFDSPPALAAGALALAVEGIYLAVAGFPFLASAGFDPDRRRRQADRLEAAGREPAQAVAIWILCRTAPLRLLRRAVLSCRNLQLPPGRIVLVHDGLHPAIPALAAELGVAHRSLATSSAATTSAGPDQAGAAADDAELIAVFDGTFMPLGGFLSRTLGFFQDARVALVQTPQKHFQSEFFNRNLGLDVVLPGDRDSFFHFEQVIRDRFNAVRACDTSFVVRRSALNGAGAETLEAVRDPALGERLLSGGWRIVYLDEVLSVGEAPRSFAAYLQQRLAAQRAQLRSLRRRLRQPAPARRDLWQSLFQLDDDLALLIPLLRVALFVLPLLALVFAVPLITASPLGYVAYGLPFLLLLAAVPGWLSGYHALPFWSAVYESLFAFPALLPLTAGAQSPAGMAPAGIAKAVEGRGSGGEPQPLRQSLLLPLALPFLLLLAVLLLTLAGRYILPMLAGTPPSGDAGFRGEDLLLLWNLANGCLLLVCLLCCIDQPVRRNGDRLPLRLPVRLRLTGGESEGQSRDLSESGAALRLTPSSPAAGSELPAAGEEGVLDLADPPLSLPVHLVRLHSDPTGLQVGLRFGALDPETDRRLLRLLYGGQLPLPQPRRVEGLTALRSLLGSLWQAEPIVRRY